MGKKRSSSQIEKLPTPVAPKDDPKDDEKPKPSSPHPEEGKVQDDEDSSSASSSSEAEDDDEEDDTPSKNSTPPAITHPKTKTEDDSDSEDEEETDSDSEDEPAPKLKSLNSNSKPVDQIKSKADPKPSSAPARSGIKRPVDNDPKQAKKRKTAAAEKEPEEDNKKSGDDSKRLFQRVFNEDDEMAIIKGIYDFIIKTETDPFKCHTAFYEFVKKSIHFKVTLEQLRDKMRRLKLKYETKAKSRKTPNFSKTNDRIMFEYGQKIWGGKLTVNEAEEKGKPNGKLSKKEPAVKKPRTTKKLVLEPDSPLPVVKETRKVESADNDNPGSSLALNELIRFDESVSGSGKTLGAMNRGFELIGESEKEELERRWEKVQVAQLEVFKMRADLAVDQAISILDALKSSSSD